MQDFKNIADFIIKTAREAGADECDVLITNTTNSSVTVRLGQIEQLKQANPKALGLRVFRGRRQALTYTSDFREDSLVRLAKKTCELALLSSEDEFSGLPEPALLGRASVKLQLYDPAIRAISPEQKVTMANRLEEIGRQQSPLITNSDGSYWNDAYGTRVLANSRGFYGQQEFSSCSLTLGLVAEKDGVKQSDYWWSSRRFFNQLDSIENIAKETARRTLRKLGGRKPATQNVPVVFDPEAGSDFLGVLASVVTGDAVYRKNSFLIGKLNEAIGPKELQIVDDSLLTNGLRSREFDDEGLPGRTNVIVENGVLKTFLCDCYSARKLNLLPTGSATRSVSSAPATGTSNFYMQKGAYSPEEIIATVKNGVLLTNIHWVGVNYVTGDYSRGAEGHWIENGKVTYPVQEFTVAGNMLTMLKGISMIGNDLNFQYDRNAPTFKINEMTISGR